ncbi:MAG: hypothetical protein AAFN07_07365 [Pseudomonadota bacterium]
MILRPAVDPELGLAPANLPVGASRFELDGVRGRFRAHVFRSQNATENADLLVVLPGAGRNADDYRNVWLETAMRRDLVVLALEFSERSYPLAAYNLAGTVRNLQYSKPEFERINKRSRVVRLNDDPFTAEAQTDQTQWLFTDIEQAIEHVCGVLGLNQARFDVFGHSAGAQVAHRMVLFRPGLAINKVVAANAGWYTFPETAVDLPLGIANSELATERLDQALTIDLVVLLGEKDNSDGAGGTLLRSSQLDALQGSHRFERGRRFFAAAQRAAIARDMKLNWSLQTVPNVGHDFRRMSAAAAEVLYPEQ